MLLQNKIPSLTTKVLQCNKNFHTSTTRMEIQKMTRLRVVDNSEIGKRAMAEGRPPKCIHVYNKTGVGKIGEMSYKKSLM